MNFLAHIFLSCNDEELMLGNFLADFLKNKDVEKLAPGIQKGVFLHRKIDSFTDEHPVVKKGTQRLREVHGKYAPVVLDVLYDYILANNWERYSKKSLKEFTTEVYKTLKDKISIMPPNLQKRLPLMIADDWLVKYGMKDGLQYTFDRMKKRTSRPELLENAVESLMDNYEELENGFNEFFPEVINYVIEENKKAQVNCQD